MIHTLIFNKQKFIKPYKKIFLVFYLIPKRESTYSLLSRMILINLLRNLWCV